MRTVELLLGQPSTREGCRKWEICGSSAYFDLIETASGALWITHTNRTVTNLVHIKSGRQLQDFLLGVGAMTRDQIEEKWSEYRRRH